MKFVLHGKGTYSPVDILYEIVTPSTGKFYDGGVLSRLHGLTVTVLGRALSLQKPSHTKS